MKWNGKENHIISAAYKPRHINVSLNKLKSLHSGNFIIWLEKGTLVEQLTWKCSRFQLVQSIFYYCCCFYGSQWDGNGCWTQWAPQALVYVIVYVILALNRIDEDHSELLCNRDASKWKREIFGKCVCVCADMRQQCVIILSNFSFDFPLD